MSDESLERWDFAGWGTATRITDLADLDPSDVHVEHLDSGHKNALGTWAATAICGNDITSSCLYVSALCAVYAGPYAPIALALVALVLYLFRGIYAEVGSALPLNGGTYTVLLNTTNKRVAAAAACLTLLSYVATAVISASEAMHYAHNLWSGLEVLSATVGLLAFFALLNLVGISESAVVAGLIFAFHLLTLTVLVAASATHVIAAPALLSLNWAEPLPGGAAKALFYGFSVAMLGISGFESSANFIEEQKPGVFPKTLRNMWLAVALFNPIISLLSLGMLPLEHIRSVPPDLLAEMGEAAAGRWLSIMVSVDAVLVLSGAVLTSFVGVTGLMQRMALDRCLPDFLLRQNKRRGTNHFIILSFLVVCVSILFATRGDVGTLAGVYTVSFLAVMALFAAGNLLLKVKRGRLPRATRAAVPVVLLALCAILAGLVGNVLIDPAYVRVFAWYAAGAVLVVGIMLYRVRLMRGLLAVTDQVVLKVVALSRGLAEKLTAKIAELNARPVIYFTRGDAPEQLNRAVLYVLDNEQTSRLVVVHVYASEHAIPSGLPDQLSHIDRCYPALRIDFVAVRGKFGPALIERLSRRLSIPKNYMFIGTPGDQFPHRIEDLGGVRVIL